MKSKPTKRLCYEDFQYGSGDIAVISERDSLHLYEAVDSLSRPENFAGKYSVFKKKIFLQMCTEKKFKGNLTCF